MKFQGKIDLWIWLVMLGGEALLITSFFETGSDITMICSFLLYNLLFLPFVFRNYVEITEENFVITFGFSKEFIPLSEITEVYQTHNPISSGAASLDRVLIKSRRKELMCSVKDKEKMFECLRERNPQIQFSPQRKNDIHLKIEKVITIFTIGVMILIGLLLITGNIKIYYGEESFTIQASYWMDKQVDYEKIENIEYRDEEISGARTGGFGSFRLLMGSFRNEEFGSYTRYTYKNCNAGIVLIVDGNELVISGKNPEETKVIYEELVKRCKRNKETL